jgi:hypothetical protein
MFAAVDSELQHQMPEAFHNERVRLDKGAEQI